MAHLRKDDRVKVLAGKEKGRQGKVIKIFKDKDTALVERLNMVKRHMKAGSSAGQHGGIIEKEAPIRLSKLMLVCPKCSKAARTGMKVLEDGSKVRYCKKCSEQLES
jgi:large subunit ribosomal protein L24